jgi:hypothetical protein
MQDVVQQAMDLKVDAYIGCDLKTQGENITRCVRGCDGCDGRDGCVAVTCGMIYVRSAL